MKLVQGITRIRGTIQTPDHIAHDYFPRARFRQLDTSKSGCDENQSFASLRNVVIGSIKYPPAAMIPKSLQLLEKRSESMVTRESWNIFKQYCFGTQAANKSQKLHN